MRAILLVGIGCAVSAWAGEWTEAVEVRHDDNLCLSYRARLDGPFLVVMATIAGMLLILGGIVVEPPAAVTEAIDKFNARLVRLFGRPAAA